MSHMPNIPHRNPPNRASVVGDPSQGPPNDVIIDKPVFNGRQMREQKERKKVDPLSTIITEYTQRRLYRAGFPSRIEHYLPPQHSYERILLPMSSTVGNESHGVLMKQQRMSKNQEKSPVNCVAFAPSGRRLVTGTARGEFTLWDGKGFHFVTLQDSHNDPIRAMEWNHSSRFMVSGDQMGRIKYWETTMNNVKDFQGHERADAPGELNDPYNDHRRRGATVRDLSFAPNDYTFVSCSDDCTLKLWDFSNPNPAKCPTLTGHGSEVMGVEWHPHHALIASGSKDHSVRLWDPRAEKSVAIMESHKHSVFRVKWNRNGNWLLSASKDQLIQLHDIRYLKPVSTFSGHRNAVHCIEWHPFHERLFASGAYDGKLMYWSVGTSEEDGPLGVIENAHNQCIWDLDWHPLGHVLCSGSKDGTTKFWIRERLGSRLEGEFDHK